MTKTHGRIRSRIFGGEALDQRAHAGEEEPDPTDAHEQRDRGEQELGDELVALAVPQRLGARRVPDQVVERREEVLATLRLDQDPHAGSCDEQPDQNGNGQKSRQAGLLRTGERHLASSAEMVAGRPPVGEAPRSYPRVAGR